MCLSPSVAAVPACEGAGHNLGVELAITGKASNGRIQLSVGEQVAEVPSMASPRMALCCKPQKWQDNVELCNSLPPLQHCLQL